MPQQRILIVDNDQRTRRYLVRIFRDERYIVTSAGDRHQVRVHLTDDLPDLIVANVPQSSRHGLDMLTYVKHVFPHIPVLVISALTTEGLSQTLKLNRTVNIINKCSYQDDLLDRIGLTLTI